MRTTIAVASATLMLASTATADASTNCGSRYPNQVAAGYPANVTATHTSCRIARLVASRCSISNNIVDSTCSSQGHTWLLTSKTLRHNGTPYGVRIHCTAGNRLVAFTEFGDD